MFPNWKQKGAQMEPKKVGENIKKLMESHNMEPKELAKKIGISEKSLIKKLNGEIEFYVNEVVSINNIFNLDANTCLKIFFGDEK